MLSTLVTPRIITVNVLHTSFLLRKRDRMFQAQISQEQKQNQQYEGMSGRGSDVPHRENTAVLVRRIRSTALHTLRDVRRVTEAFPSKRLVPELRSFVCAGVPERGDTLSPFHTPCSLANSLRYTLFLSANWY